MKKPNLSPDVLVVGAGPAGSSAAALMASAGYSVVVLEKSIFPRFSIGESLLPHCMDLLEESGMLEAVKARGYQVKTGAIFRRNGESSAFDFGHQFTRGWPYTYQVPRDDFDNVLIESAVEKGVQAFFNYAITAVDFSGDHPRVTVETPEGETLEMTPRFVFDASGFGRVLPRLLGTERPSSFPVRTSIFTHVTHDPGDPDTQRDKITVLIHPDDPQVWYWAIPLSESKTSVGIVAEPAFLEQFPEPLEERFRALVNAEPNLRERLKNMELLMPPRCLKGYSQSVESLYGRHYALLGNSGEFLDPVFSSGVTIAFKSASLASRTLIRQFEGKNPDWQSEFAEIMEQGIEAFKTFVTGWYDGKFQKVIFSSFKQDDYVRQICSILAGYVWDKNNILAVQHRRSLNALAELCESHAH